MGVFGGREGWKKRAACSGADPNMFFPERGDSCAEAVAICRSCPVREDCREYAIADPWLHGIWGGTSQEGRRAIRAAQRQARAA